jgi:hypothetical protein
MDTWFLHSIGRFNPIIYNALLHRGPSFFIGLGGGVMKQVLQTRLHGGPQLRWIT